MSSGPGRGSGTGFTVEDTILGSSVNIDRVTVYYMIDVVLVWICSVPLRLANGFGSQKRNLELR